MKQFLLWGREEGWAGTENMLAQALPQSTVLPQSKLLRQHNFVVRYWITSSFLHCYKTFNRALFHHHEGQHPLIFFPCFFFFLRSRGIMKITEDYKFEGNRDIYLILAIVFQ